MLLNVTVKVSFSAWVQWKPSLKNENAILKLNKSTYFKKLAFFANFGARVTFNSRFGRPGMNTGLYFGPDKTFLQSLE